MPQSLRLLLVALESRDLESALHELQPDTTLSVLGVPGPAGALEAIGLGNFDAVVIRGDEDPAWATAVPVLASAAALLVLAPQVPVCVRTEAADSSGDHGWVPADGGEDRRGLSQAITDAPSTGEHADPLAWIRLGAEEVVWGGTSTAHDVALRLCLAVERKRIELASRRAYATDLNTGLPHRQQFIEHVSQLLALREREPAPMAVLVLRIEGFSTTQNRLGVAAADALRRKIAVRLRASVRASDVVAVLDEICYAVFLGTLLSPDDAVRVAKKLAQGLMAPFSVGGTAIAVAVAVGFGSFPADGSDADALLRKAIAAALDAPAQGRIGMSNFVESGVAPLEAANDEREG